MIVWLWILIEVHFFWKEHSPALTSLGSWNLPVLPPDGFQQANAPPFGRRADRRALERNIKSTLWVENVPLCVCMRMCVFVQTFFPLGRLLGGDVWFSRSGNCVYGTESCLDHVHCVVYRCVFSSVELCMCVNDVMFEFTQTDNPNQDTKTRTNRYMCVCVLESIDRPDRLAQAGLMCVCVCMFLAELQFVFSNFEEKRQLRKHQQSACWFMQLPVPSITPTTTTEAEFVFHYFWCKESKPQRARSKSTVQCWSMQLLVSCYYGTSRWDINSIHSSQRTICPACGWLVCLACKPQRQLIQRQSLSLLWNFLFPVHKFVHLWSFSYLFHCQTFIE